MTGVLRSPNIWDSPHVYELENRAADPYREVDAALERLHPLAGVVVVDVGCGSGFHLPRLAARGAHVVGVEPHPPLVALARDRLRGGAATARRRAVVLCGWAEALPLATGSVDVVCARWAYFFGAGCEPGLAEAQRVLRPGGVVAVVDVDATRSTFGRWFRGGYPAYDPEGTERFWARQGFTTERLTVPLAFRRRADLEAVLRIELPPEAAARAIAEHAGLVVDQAVALRWRRTG
ncbi:MAG TPA: methyltransferase domain-containing protein [Dermatophilaceae bacterium]|nr:methyltransferase domain-containing protein [Dermatophilaceae bacterium]